MREVAVVALSPNTDRVGRLDVFSHGRVPLLVGRLSFVGLWAAKRGLPALRLQAC